MNLQSFLQVPWGIMAPEITIFTTAVLLLIADLVIDKALPRRTFVWPALAGIAVAFVICLAQIGTPVTSIWFGAYRVDAFALAFKLLLLVGTGFVLLLSCRDERPGELSERAEFYFLLLSALTGAMMLTSSADLITLFVSLELLSLSSYLLAGLHKSDRSSNEAAFKYIVNGGIATAVILFGMSYLYGFSGSTNLYAISEVFNADAHHPVVFDERFLLVFAFILLFAGLSFKLATVPFHMWAPDVYEGAPTSVTAFLSVVSKTAGFALLFRLMLVAFLHAPGAAVSSSAGPESIFTTVQPYLAVLAAAAMIYGNTAALKQTNIKRLFAYSGIAQAGYVLVPFVCLTQLTLTNVWFYLAAYLFTNLGAFAVIQAVSSRENSSQLKTYDGLYSRSPFAAVALAVFLVSLAGIPFTSGFVAKFDVFVEALFSDHYALASIMIATTVIAYFYYFVVMAKMFLRPSASSGRWMLPPAAGIVAVICLIATIGIGIFPSTVLGFLHDHFPLAELFKKG
ncbi:MAG TPA: NADH-quinone oxidoreductase subunit NuoN [Bacillales bacterium]|nr:NADH-quinone oxidoreductase subunit NuoN [Bacillales bacterium]